MSSLRQKLLGAIGLPALLVAVVGVSGLTYRAHGAATASASEKARNLAGFVRSAYALTSVPNLDLLHLGAHPPLDALLDTPVFDHVRTLRLLDDRGVVVWSREPTEVGLHLGLKGDGRRDIILLEGPRVGLVGPLEAPGCLVCRGGLGRGEIQLAIDKPRLLARVDAVGTSGLAAVLLFALAIGLATLLSLHFFLTRPLRRLMLAMKKAEQGQFLVRAEVTGEDEIGQLATAFNRMLENMTAIKAEEIDTHRSLEMAHEQLALKAELEASNVQLETRVNQLSLLYDIARSLTSTLQLQELLNRVGTIVATRLHFRRFSLMLLSGHDRLEVKVALPPSNELSPVSFAVGEGACGRAAETLRTVYLADLSSDATFEARGRSKPFGSLLSIPIVHQEVLLGVLNFERPEPAAFDAEDIDLLTAVADQVAMAVQNARLHEETVALSITDPLTGVPNRRHLFARLEMEWARAQRFATPMSFVMVDIDHFKKLNDAAGHRAGDVTLRQVADLLKVQVRKVDTLARYGGEEFALILPHVPKGEALEVAEKLRRAVADHKFTHGKTQPTGKVTLSVGVASFPADAKSLDDLVDAADSSLYASKRGGRNLVTGYAPGMETHPGRERGPHVNKKGRQDEPSGPFSRTA